jgi:hypothetical protein
MDDIVLQRIEQKIDQALLILASRNRNAKYLQAKEYMQKQVGFRKSPHLVVDMLEPYATDRRQALNFVKRLVDDKILRWEENLVVKDPSTKEDVIQRSTLQIQNKGD